MKKKVEFNGQSIVMAFAIIILIVGINRIPLDRFLLQFGCSDFVSNALESIVFNSLGILIVCYALFKIKVIVYSRAIIQRNILYYGLLIIPAFIFSGGFTDFRRIDLSAIDKTLFWLYCLKLLSSSFIEEILFRGLILGVFLQKYGLDNKGVLKSVVYSSLIFGVMHIINFFTQPGFTFVSALNQIYAAGCLGFMFGAIYLKTKNIIMLGIFHFFINFFSMIGVLTLPIEISPDTPSQAVESISLLNTVISEIVRIVIFGIPLLIGLFVLQNTKIDVVKSSSIETT